MKNTKTPATSSKKNRISRAALERILFSVSNGQTLKAACREENLPLTSVWERLTRHEPERYARAQEIGTHAMVEAAIEKIESSISPEEANLLRVKWDVVKWTAGKRLPTYYGEKTQMELSGSVGVKRVDELTEEELLAIAAKRD